MALPDRDTLKTRVRQRLRDSEAAFVTDVQIEQWLNEAYLDLNARLRLNKAAATGTASTTGVVTLPGGPPSDVVEINSLWLTDDDIKVEFVDDYTFLWYSNQAQSTGDKVLGRMGTTQDTIETYPIAASEPYALEYIKRPTLMTAGASTPVILTEELAPRLVFYAVAEAKMQEGETEEAGVYMGRYLEGLPGSPRTMYRKDPQTLTLIPEQGPMDVL